MIFEHLFTPIQIGTMTVKNRIGLPPMTVGYGTAEATLTDRHRAYYEARAAGGAGLIVTEAAAINGNRKYGLFPLGLYEDAQIPSWAKLADAVHPYGTKVGVQLMDPGPESIQMLTGDSARRPVGGGRSQPLPFASARDDHRRGRGSGGRFRHGGGPCTGSGPRLRTDPRRPWLRHGGFVPLALLQQAHRSLRRLARGPAAIPARDHRGGPGQGRPRLPHHAAHVGGRAPHGRTHAAGDAVHRACAGCGGRRRAGDLRRRDSDGLLCRRAAAGHGAGAERTLRSGESRRWSTFRSSAWVGSIPRGWPSS